MSGQCTPPGQSEGGWSAGPFLDQPPRRGTPIAVDGKLLVSTENNGTRLYRFDRQGTILPEPVAVNLDLAPDSSTPVVIGGKLFGCWDRLFCLEVNSGLDVLWSGLDEAFEDYVSIIGDRERLLITSAKGELLLVRADGKKYELISRLRLFGKDSEVLSHPALVGRRLYIRDGFTICCIDLDAD